MGSQIDIMCAFEPLVKKGPSAEEIVAEIKRQFPDATDDEITAAALTLNDIMATVYAMKNFGAIPSA